MESIGRDKDSILLQTFVNYNGTFCKIGPWMHQKKFNWTSKFTNQSYTFSPQACPIKLFTLVNQSQMTWTRSFVTAEHFQPIVTLAQKWHPRTCTIKPFTDKISWRVLTVRHFHPSLIFASKLWAYSSVWDSLIRQWNKKFYSIGLHTNCLLKSTSRQMS